MNSLGRLNKVNFQEMPLIAILRNQEAMHIRALVSTIAEAGFRAIEITMTSPGAAGQIETALHLGRTDICIGAGTVTTLTDLKAAIAAGAEFIVTPFVDAAIMAECQRRNLPVFPGAFTPGEVFTAHRLGAAMVKLFPAHRLGPGYIRDLKAPLPKIPLLPTGGITPEVMAEYMACGADGFGIGSPLLPPERVTARDWKWVHKQAARFCQTWAQARG